MKAVSKENGRVLLLLTGAWTKEEQVFLQLRLKNNSPLAYSSGYLRFFTRDKKRPKLSAVQEEEHLPLYVAGNGQNIQQGEERIFVVALPKFSLSSRQELAIQLGEKDGSRHFEMNLDAKKLLRAEIIPDTP